MEGGRVKVATGLVLGGLVDVCGAARGVGDHEVLLVARPRHLRLHRQVGRLAVVLLLVQPQHHLVNYLVRRVRSPTPSPSHQIRTLGAVVLGRLVVVHGGELVAARGC